MSTNDAPRLRWLLRLQSAYVLPLARGIYLFVALASLLAVMGGVLYVLYLLATAAAKPSLAPLPPAFQQSEEGVEAPPREMDLAVVERRLDPPTDVRFYVATGTITAPLAEDTLIGYFQASTPNGLAPFPDGLSILGGRDAELFERVPLDRQQIGLSARPGLVAKIEEALDDIAEKQTRTFEIRVIARDEYGSVSAPTDLSFDLSFGPALPAESADAEPSPEADPSELQKIAREIAQTLEPTVNPAHFAVYRTATETPSRCGARDDDAVFLASYRRAFDNTKSRVTAKNIGAFYAGLCEAWEAVLQREAALQQQAEQERRSARRAAEQARDRVEASNARLLAEHETKVLRARIQTPLTLSVVVGALAVFLSVALVLAFLAIEGHSRALRAAAESLVKLTEQRETKAAPAGEGAQSG